MFVSPLTPHWRRLLACALLGLLGLVLGVKHFARHATAAPAVRIAPVGAVGARRPRVVRTLLVVDVAGAVRRPGLYRLPTGSRVADAVARAGGLARNAERSGVNLAAPVADGEQVLVAARGSPAGSSGGAAAASASAAAPVSLSSASVEQLDALPGVGPVTAQKIIDYRQEHGAFSSVDELDAIPGIGPARLRDLRGLVVP
jgi:competence protein ComEA